MSRVFVRPRRAAGAWVAVVVAMGLSVGAGPLLPSASAADTPQETVVPAATRGSHESASLFYADTQSGTDGAGAEGVFHQLEGRTGLVWTRYADGSSTPVPAGTVPGSNRGTGTDVLARNDGSRFSLWNASTGTTETVQVPDGLDLLGVYGTTVVAFRNGTSDDGLSMRVIHLLTPNPDGTTRDVTVSGMPAGLRLALPRAADARSLLFVAQWDDTHRMVAVDRETGRVQSWTQPIPVANILARMSKDHVVLYFPSNPKVLVLPRSDLSATPAELTLGGADSRNPANDLALVGEWLVHRPGTAVLAQPLTGGKSVTVVASSNPGVSSAPDGSAVVVGRTTVGDSDDWGIQRLAPGSDGHPVATQVKALPKPVVGIQGLSLEQGRLVVTDPSSGRRGAYLRTVSPTGTPEFGARSAFTESDVVMAPCPAQDVGCSAVRGTADGRIAWLERGQPTDLDRLRVHGPNGFYDRGVPAGGRITDVSGNYVIYAGTDQQYVYRLDDSGNPVTRPKGAAALWDDVLLTAGSTPGSIAGFDLRTRKATAALATDAGCVPAELQAVGRWLYWSCGPGGKAGVYDRTAKKSLPVPSGEAGLGDGFVVTHDRAAGRLTLTTVTGGKAVGRDIGELPDTGVSQRDVRWTVDKAGTNAAYVDAREQVHLVPSGATAQPLRLLTGAENAASVTATAPNATPGPLTEVLLSKPSAQWTLTVRSGITGKVVDTVRGGAAQGALGVGWHGLDRSRPGQVFLPNGRYDWSLSVAPQDGLGAPLTVTGTVRLAGGADVWRDLSGDDGFGDLLALNSAGLVYSYQGTGTGGLRARQAATGGTFPATALLVPFGDTDGDGCDDVLVRQGNELRAYRPGCGVTVSASSPYTVIGSGWAQYDVLTSPGDVDGDGFVDLYARQKTTGDMYFYAGTATHRLATKVRIGTNWKLYSKIVGAGDLNGDGRGDLLGIDTSGGLWRYDGKAAGAVTSRVRIASGWGTSYTTVVGMGDITGDGRTDIVARDAKGKLYRHSGTAAGTLAGPVTIGTSGWSAYKGLY
ncbi:FG-GAP repeat domain-containing protein [Streptomyces sp. NPDC059818]|uniref:FG-GAP repeat domain-containing protein n=1 Tax=Streptomyces sp. NPDC059818 TaxID=3346962 RepID=UPI00365F514F